MRRSRELLATVLTIAAGMLFLAAGAARADSAAPLTQLSAFHQILVDESAGYVFLSEGQDSYSFFENATYGDPGIVVTDLAGTYLTTIDAGDGVEGMALSADGETLYAALGADSAVAAIDVSSITAATTTPSQTLLDLNGTERPYSVSLQSGKLWVSYNPSTSSPPGLSTIGYFDLSQADPVFDDQLLVNFGYGWWDAPQLTSDPADSGVLMAYSEEDYPATVAAYIVDGQLGALANPSSLEVNGQDGCDSANQLAVVPGGSEFITACGYPYSQYVFSTTGLSQVGSYPAGAFPQAVAIASGTALVAAGTDTSTTGAPSIYIYEPGGATPVNAYGFGADANGAQILATAGLALSPDGSELYAVTTDGSMYTLHVLDQPALPRTSLTLIGPATAAATGHLTLNGTLTLANGPAPAGETVSVTRTSDSGTVTLPSVTTHAGGAFTVPDSPPAAGTDTYTASLLAEGGTVVATASYTVTVTPDTSSLTLTATAGKKGVVLTGTLSFNGKPAPAGATIVIVRTAPDGSFFPYTLPPVTTTSNGTYTLTDAPGQSETYVWTATYAGDTTDGAATSTTPAVKVTVKR